MKLFTNQHYIIITWIFIFWLINKTSASKYLYKSSLPFWSLDIKLISPQYQINKKLLYQHIDINTTSAFASTQGTQKFKACSNWLRLRWRSGLGVQCLRRIMLKCILQLLGCDHIHMLITKEIIAPPAKTKAYIYSSA